MTSGKWAVLTGAAPASGFPERCPGQAGFEGRRKREEWSLQSAHMPGTQEGKRPHLDRPLCDMRPGLQTHFSLSRPSQQGLIPQPTTPPAPTSPTLAPWSRLSCSPGTTTTAAASSVVPTSAPPLRLQTLLGNTCHTRSGGPSPLCIHWRITPLLTRSCQPPCSGPSSSAGAPHPLPKKTFNLSCPRGLHHVLFSHTPCLEVTSPSRPS